MITIKLIEAKGGIPFEVGDVMRGMLVGQASILYAGLFSNANKEECIEIDRLFQKVLMRIGIVENFKDYVDDGRCTFSPLSLTDLLFLHYYLRQDFEKMPSVTHRPWAMLASQSGTTISLDYMVEENITVLSGYLSAIQMFISELFKSNPSALVFGGQDKLTSLVLFNGQEHFLSVANPEETFKQEQFIEGLNRVPPEIMGDILPELKQFLAQKTAEKIERKLIKSPLSTLLVKYTEG